MTGRLSNESIKSFILKQIVKQYKRFVVGANNSLVKDSQMINNKFIIPLIESNFMNVGKDATSFVDNFKDIFSPGNILSDSDKEMETIRDEYIFDLLDNNYAAFFLKDIIAGKPFKSLDRINKSNYFVVVHEPDKDRKKYFDKDISVKNMVAVIPKAKVELTPDSNEQQKDAVQKVATENVERVVPLQRVIAVQNPEPKPNKYLNVGQPNAIPDRLNPSLGAIVIRKHGIGLPAKNSEHLNIFFNAISTLEMSRCTPYIDIAFVTRPEVDLPSNVNNVTFMRFIKEEKIGKNESRLVLNESIGLSSAKPFNFDSIFGVSGYSLENDPNISLMDVFTSPQVMANANINKDVRYIEGVYGNEVLEPIAPLLSLSDLSISIAGMGVALFSSKVGSITLKLHDRSRLADISHLVSPKHFGTTKMIIEFGWSHPEGNLANDNIIGQFLNAMRDRSVYTVKSSNFSFSDGNTVNIGLALACYGQQQSSNISCAGGEEVPVNIFKEGIKSMIESIELDKTKARPNEIKEIRNVMKVNLRNATANTRMIDFEQYSDLVKAFTSFKSSMRTKADKETVKRALANIIFADTKGIPPDQLTQEEIENIKEEQKNTINSLVQSKLRSLSMTRKNGTFNKSKFLTNIFKQDSKQIDNALERINTEFINNNLNNAEKYIPLGDIFMSFIGHPLSMSGMFDEVQMIFYPLNIHSGGASIHTTASMPIEYSILEGVVNEKINAAANLSVKGFFNLIESKIIRDRSISVYGINQVIAKNKSERELIENNAEYTAAKERVEALQKTRDVNIEEQSEELLRELAELQTTQEEQAEQEEKIKEIQDKINNIKEKEESEYKIKSSEDIEKIKEVKEQLLQKQRELEANIQERVKSIYQSQSDGMIREAKFVRPNLTLYMETVIQRDPAATVSGSPFNLINLPDYLITLKNQLGLSAFEKHSGVEKTICRIHIYDESASSNPRKQLIQSIMTEGAKGEIIDSNKTINPDDVMKEYGLNTSKKIKNFVKNSYPSITYGANNSTVNGISITSNVSDQVSQVIQISSYAKRNAPQSSASEVSDFDEITVVPASVSLRMMGCPFISRGNEIYIDFGTNTTLDNIYTVKDVSHSINSGKFETTVGLIYSGQGDTKSIAGDIKRVLKNI